MTTERPKVVRWNLSSVEKEKHVSDKASPTDRDSTTSDSNSDGAPIKHIVVQHGAAGNSQTYDGPNKQPPVPSNMLDTSQTSKWSTQTSKWSTGTYAKTYGLDSGRTFGSPSDTNLEDSTPFDLPPPPPALGGAGLTEMRTEEDLTERDLDEVEDLAAELAQELMAMDQAMDQGAVTNSLRSSVTSTVPPPTTLGPQVTTMTFSDQTLATARTMAGTILSHVDARVEAVRFQYHFDEDIYTMMIFLKWNSYGFFYSIFIFLCQMVILSLVLVDLIDDDGANIEGSKLGVNADGRADGSKLNVPVDIETQVAVTQVIALVLVVVTLNDLHVSIGAAALGWKPPFVFESSETGVTLWKWWMSTVLRFIEGCYLITVSFILLVQSTTILDIFLNFAALAFVSELDNLAFTMAAFGFVGRPLRDQAKSLKNKEAPQVQRAHWIKPIVVVLLIAGLCMGWSVIHRRQRDDYYLQKFLESTTCRHVWVDLGEEVYVLPRGVDLTTVLGKAPPRILGTRFNTSSPPDIRYAYFSGDYYAQFDSLIGKRPVYYERDDAHPSSGMFYYCTDINAWVFTIQAFAEATGVNAIPEELRADCGDGLGWLLASPRTDATVLNEAPTTGWVAWTGKIETVKSLAIRCLECTRDVNCGGNRGVCDQDTNTCICDDGFEGPLCNIDTPCSPLIVFTDKNEEYGPYHLETQRAYDRPIYVRNATLENRPGRDFEVVIYTGRRWYDIYLTTDLTRRYGLFGFDSDIELTLVERQAYWLNLFVTNAEWYSEITETTDPIGSLQWFQIAESRSRGSYAPFGFSYRVARRFECLSINCAIREICGDPGTGNQCVEDQPLQVNSSNAYLLNGTQVMGGDCQCSDDFEGHFCEYTNRSSSAPSTIADGEL